MRYTDHIKEASWLLGSTAVIGFSGWLAIFDHPLIGLVAGSVAVVGIAVGVAFYGVRRMYQNCIAARNTYRCWRDRKRARKTGEPMLIPLRTKEDNSSDFDPDFARFVEECQSHS